MEPTHASFFSGVGGLDLGLERAGWRTVSFSEIDPYASAVLAERWPGVPNLGDIAAIVPDGELGDGRHVAVSAVNGEATGATSDRDPLVRRLPLPGPLRRRQARRNGNPRRPSRHRSGLAYAFLDLVERHRPPAILLENVPGLLSSNGGRDFGALLGRLGDSGMGGPTGFSTLSSSECPSADDGCSFSPSTLSQVLSRQRRSGSICRLALRRAFCGGRRGGDGASDGLAAGISRSLSTGRSESTPTPNPSSSVRRLTPVETERLMGWPDGHTIVKDWKGRK